MMDFSFTTGTLVVVFIVGFLVAVAAIVLFRIYYHNVAESGLPEKYKDKQWASPLKARNKYPDVDVFSWSNTLFGFGVAAAIAMIFVAFNWTTYEKEVYIPDGALTMDDIEVQETPRTAEPPPPPPPPPPPAIEEVPEELMEEEDEVEFVDQTVEEETVVERPDPVVEKKAPPPPPPPPPPKEEEEEIFKVVEDMPRFPGCENAGDKTARKKCAEGKMLKFIYGNIKYPAIARENGVEGAVVISFVVEKNGKITDARIVRDIGAQCGDEALRVVNKMPKWVPGKQRGRPVRVQFNLPVRFKLQ